MPLLPRMGLVKRWKCEEKSWVFMAGFRCRESCWKNRLCSQSVGIGCGITRWITTGPRGCHLCHHVVPGCSWNFVVFMDLSCICDSWRLRVLCPPTHPGRCRLIPLLHPSPARRGWIAQGTWGWSSTFRRGSAAGLGPAGRALSRGDSPGHPPSTSLWIHIQQLHFQHQIIPRAFPSTTQIF